MFTQCSKCETVFRLSADALRAAGGQVRCGLCGEVFNALSRLAEDTTGFAKGESPLFLEARAEEILESNSYDMSEAPVDIESAYALDEAGHGDDSDLTPGVDVAQLHFIGAADDELAARSSLEFTLPPGELDRIFIETRPGPLRQLGVDGNRTELDDVAPPHPEALPVHPESSPGAHPESSPESHEDLVLVPTASPPILKQVPSTAPSRRAPLSRNTGLEVSDELRQEMLSGLRTHPLRDPTPSRSRSQWRSQWQSHSQSRSRIPAQSARRTLGKRLPFAAWLTAAILLGMLLAIQAVRGNSDWVAAHVPLLGRTASTIANVSVYQLRQWGVTGDPGARGTLNMRASILNTAPQLQPYPLLRVTLADRFGARVGAREFEPAEYLGHDIDRMLAPGERVDASLDILDPGKDAESFEIDVCIRSIDRKIVCAGDAAAQAK